MLWLSDNEIIALWVGNRYTIENKQKQIDHSAYRHLPRRTFPRADPNSARKLIIGMEKQISVK